MKIPTLVYVRYTNQSVSQSKISIRNQLHCRLYTSVRVHTYVNPVLEKYKILTLDSTSLPVREERHEGRESPTTLVRRSGLAQAAARAQVGERVEVVTSHAFSALAQPFMHCARHILCIMERQMIHCLDIDRQFILHSICTIIEIVLFGII